MRTRPIFHSSDDYAWGGRDVFERMDDDGAFGGAVCLARGGSAIWA
jgi:hypothetical protein